MGRSIAVVLAAAVILVAVMVFAGARGGGAEEQQRTSVEERDSVTIEEQGIADLAASKTEGDPATRGTSSLADVFDTPGGKLLASALANARAQAADPLHVRRQQIGVSPQPQPTRTDR